MNNNIFIKTEVKTNQEIAKGVFVITFAKSFMFKAGQVVSIKVTENTPFRMYSILSGERDTECKILYNIYPSGFLTNQLKKLKPGDTLFVSNPFGEFLHNYKPGSYCICTGTGIAPFYSLFRSGEKNFNLIQGARKKEHFYFQYEFMQIGPKYVRCASSEHSDGVFKGRLTQYLKTCTFDIAQLFFLCGNADMVVEVREILQQKGVPFNQIYSEIYF